ncbi:hypothetical protein EJB05_04398, partial [Eragrostis curvula]
MAGAAGDRPDGVGDWPFAGADAFPEFSSVFAELGWPGGLAAGAGDQPVLDLPEAAAPPAELARPDEVMAPARSGDAGASSSSSGDGDGSAPGNGDQKPAAEAVAAAVALAEQTPFVPAQRLYGLPSLHPRSSPSSSETAVTSALTALQHLNGSEELRRTSYNERVSMALSPSTPSSSSSVPPAISVEKGLLDDIVPHGTYVPAYYLKSCPGRRPLDGIEADQAVTVSLLRHSSAE